MSQTTDFLSLTDGDLEIGTDGTTYTNFSGSSNSVDAPSQARMTGDDYTLDGDTAIITSGKREPMDIAVNVIYTENVSEIWDVIRGYFQAGTRIYLRWSPKGIGAASRNVFTAANVVISNFVYPGLNASEANPARGAFTIRAPFVTKTLTGNSTGLGTNT
jgi:hypothetical protein